jgi:hypothetical protein
LPFFKTPFSFFGKKPFVKFFVLPLPADEHSPKRFFTRENADLSIIEFFQIIQNKIKNWKMTRLQVLMEWSQEKKIQN